MICNFNSFAQNRNSIWCFGDSAGIDFRILSAPQVVTTSLDTRGTCASTSDSEGNLLFYGNTRAGLRPSHAGIIYDRSGAIMMNGDSLHGEGWYNEMLFLTSPKDSSKYIIINLEILNTPGIYYSIIDMNENNGLGAVVEKNIQIESFDTWDAMAAVRHANGRDWWLIGKDYTVGGLNGNNIFHIYLITGDTIIKKDQSVGANAIGNLGNMCVSNTGDKFLFATWNGMAEVLDFDRCTGTFSNYRPIHVASSNRFFGACFSPSGQYVYLCHSDTLSELYQYDLNAPNILGSKKTLATITHPKYAGGQLRLAPDNKIYWSNAWTNQITYIYPYQDSVYHPENMNLSVINSPDSPGVAADVSLYSFYLGGKRTYWGLPNNPDYELGPVVGSVCDSLSSGIAEINHKKYFTLYPNPFSKEISLSLVHDDNAMLTVHNQLGQLVFKSPVSRNEQFEFSKLQSGIYLFGVEINGRRFNQKVIKIAE